jgi:hypothetical protein
MDRSIMKFVVFTVVLAVALAIGVIALNAQVPCVLHPYGDIVPCTHWVATPYGPRALHPYDVVPCVHFVPCN